MSSDVGGPRDLPQPIGAHAFAAFRSMINIATSPTGLAERGGRHIAVSGAESRPQLLSLLQDCCHSSTLNTREIWRNIDVSLSRKEETQTCRSDIDLYHRKPVSFVS